MKFLWHFHQVFDYDWGLSDDFMGMTSLDPSRLPLNKPTDLSLTLTETNTDGTEYMGELFMSVTLVPRSIEEKEIVRKAFFVKKCILKCFENLQFYIFNSG